MPNNQPDFNIFKEAPGSFQEALPLFSRATEFAVPVALDKSGPAPLYTVTPVQENGRPHLPAFTGGGMLTPPFIILGRLETALMFFHAAAYDSFIFNPPHPQSRLTAASLGASRRQISLLAGFFQTPPGPASKDHSRMAAQEFSLGNLHKAHYFYTLALTRNPASSDRFGLYSVLIELGLLQEAYDSLKAETAPEALVNLAAIYRKTGNPQKARELLAAVPPGTFLEDRRALETAWLDLEEGKDDEAEKTFQRLTTTAFDKTEALLGLGEVISKTAIKTRDKALLAAAASTLRSALAHPSQVTGRILFQLGNIYFRAGDAAQAEDCYAKSAALAPAAQALANLALALVKTGKMRAAAGIIARIALTDPATAGKLSAGLSREGLEELAQRVRSQAALQPAAAGPEASLTPSEPIAPPPAPLSAGSTPQKDGPPDAAQPRAAASLVAAAPKSPPPPPVPARKPSEPLVIETLKDVMSSTSAPTLEDDKRDDFISRAFKLASLLEDESGRKIYFNPDGLMEVERKLRLVFIKDRDNASYNVNLIKDCAAFLCYVLQERNKGRLVKLPDFDPWSWPMVLEQPGIRMTTYPAQRVWRLLWDKTLPEPGWLGKYCAWVAGRLKTSVAPPEGAAAVKARIMSHPERVIDVQTEHRHILILASSLQETSFIELTAAGLPKLESAIKHNFKPNTPPTTDGWKLLRCFGHMLAEILAKDFNASWYNVEGGDGLWSMQTPWKTFVFPLGKVYRTATGAGDLTSYYETLEAEKRRHQKDSEPAV